MALPRLNDTPNYQTKVPSTGETVSFRPYLVKEEKVLMIAFETGEQKEALRAIVDTLKACIDEDINFQALTTFDIEYLFTQVRSKAVGEVATIMLPCSSCEHKNEVDVDIASIKVDIPEVDNVIELTPNVSVEMRYPAYTTLMELDFEGSEAEVGFAMLANCIASIQTDEERIDTRDVPTEEIQEFIGQMTTDQFQKVSVFLQDLPQLKKEQRFQCEKCGEMNEHTLKGIQDFLS